ncbi:haloacid dehalogenase [Bradyrhizobium sp. SSBR45G]|uniref:HAD family hydrolase n=1 Tax=unclassified Bradyrhizobium TaxID=2631580 RepID=UPI002342901D|nr:MULTISPECIES: HAD family hydrolase [unclassified Bradyrhizobium]GLH77768.1 haloacid dehalogenase [Bradyrhizobium sp. SSBR45G]GLH85005.1 haloacid dehalogenase [Bradyrhizobium sp. SSBR45R]
MADATPASKLDLVIFDCDGVLVDSEVISCQAHADVLSLCGYPITADQVFDRFLGRSSKQATQEIEAELGRSLPEDFNARLQERLFRTFEQELQPIAGIAEVLDTLDLPVCVASSGSHQRMRVSLGATRLYDRLAPHIFSSSQVENGKPAPDLFLFAAAQMNARPAACVVVEDSLAGIQGGVAAGMTVLGFHGGSHGRPGHADRLKAAGATLVFDDMRQLPLILSRLGDKAAPLAGFSAV